MQTVYCMYQYLHVQLEILYVHNVKFLSERKAFCRLCRKSPMLDSSGHFLVSGYVQSGAPPE
jgi:hypothetical protein